MYGAFRGGESRCVEFCWRSAELTARAPNPQHYAEKCYHCKTPIAESEYINIADPRLLPPTPLRTYHATHFFCAACGDPFVDPTSLARGKEHTLAKPYIVHKGYAYCQGCDLRVYKPKCVGCAQGIAGDFLETNEGSKWHEGCFCCVVRSGRFSSSSSYSLSFASFPPPISISSAPS